MWARLAVDAPVWQPENQTSKTSVSIWVGEVLSLCASVTEPELGEPFGISFAFPLRLFLRALSLRMQPRFLSKGLFKNKLAILGSVGKIPFACLESRDGLGEGR